MPTIDNFKLADNVSFTELDGEAVLLNLNTGAYFGLNHVGAKLVNLLQTDHSVATAVEKISIEYGVSTEIAKNDIDALIKDMSSQGLLVNADG